MDAATGALTAFEKAPASSDSQSGCVTRLSLSLSRALAKGRAAPAPQPTRAELLVTLLRKRAAAYNAGAPELEAMLRAQIRWALPMVREG